MASDAVQRVAENLVNAAANLTVEELHVLHALGEHPDLIRFCPPLANWLGMVAYQGMDIRQNGASYTFSIPPFTTWHDSLLAGALLGIASIQDACIQSERLGDFARSVQIPILSVAATRLMSRGIAAHN